MAMHINASLAPSPRGTLNFIDGCMHLSDMASAARHVKKLEAAVRWLTATVAQHQEVQGLVGFTHTPFLSARGDL